MNPSGSSSGGARSQEPVGPFLRVRIAGLERNRKDLLIRFDVSVSIESSVVLILQTNLPNFRTSLYRNMQRSYVEFQRFAEQLQMCCPQSRYISDESDP